LAGDDKKLCDALLDGNKGAAQAVRIHQSDGIFTNDKDKAFAQMEGKSPEERKAMQQAFTQTYGISADDYMAKEFGKDSDDLQAARQLEKDGKMDPAFELKYAISGAGTDMARMRDALHGKSPEEIARIKADYRKLTGHDLESDIAGETKMHSMSLVGPP